MELHIQPETEAKLNDLVARTQRDRNELLEEAVNHLLAYNDWLEKKVSASVAAAERGEVVPDNTVRAWIDGRC